MSKKPKKTPRKRAAQGAKKPPKRSPARESNGAGEFAATDANNASFPIVGVGASAGGLQALKDLLDAMPADGGVALIIVQHLDPTRRSLAPELLAQHTRMRLCEVADGPRVQPNSVYLIPPGKYLSISDGVLRLSDPDEPRGARRAVDFFLRSLALDQQHRSVGVILSGGGDDGSLGIKAIKEAGGMIIVQDPNSAEHDSMPRNAIRTGAVDFVVPVGKIPELLCRYANAEYIRQSGPAPADEPADLHADLKATEVFNDTLSLLRAHSKHDFRDYKTQTLTRRTRRRMSLLHIEDQGQYLDYLRGHPDEVEALVKDLLISVTSFFRDPDAWSELRQHVIKPLVEEKGPDEPIRIWTPGCATGEEPYSLAMLLLEEVSLAKKNNPLQVFASDVDKAALEHARSGSYFSTIEADVPPELLKRYLIPRDDRFHVSKALRETLVFAEQDLVSDPPFSKLDLICCRNLLIYLKTEVQDRLMSMFHFALRQGGYLFLGSAETVGRQDSLFRTLNKRWRIYRRVGAAHTGKLEIPTSSFPRRRALDGVAPAREPRESGMAQLANQYLIDWLAPAAVLVDEKWQILFISGNVDPYLKHATGVPSNDLLEKARRGLRSKLRAVVHRALQEKRLATITAAAQRGGEYRSVRLMARPVADMRNERRLALVLFEDVPRQGPVEQGKEPHRGQAAKLETPASAPEVRVAEDSELDEHHIIRQLEDEITGAKDELQSLLEQYESSNEEFKAANEEVMSVNEELQSTNEELETSKEELQSLNEELSTVNNQLAAKVDELETKHADLENLLMATDLPTICLDAQFRIRWFTPAANRIIRIKESDSGRPLSDIAHDFLVDDLGAISERVLKTLSPVEDEVACHDGRSFIRRVVLYRNEEHWIGGVVLTFVDITERKRIESRLRESEAEFRAMFESTNVGMSQADPQTTRILRVNEKLCELLDYSATELVGQTMIELTHPDDRESDRRQFQGLADQLFPEFSLEKRLLRKDGNPVSVDVYATLLRDTTGAPSCSVAVVVDLTARKEVENALREREAELVALTESLERKSRQRTELLNVLHDITVSANEAQTIDGALQAALERLCEFNGLMLGRVWLADESEELVSTSMWRWSRGSAARANQWVGHLGSLRERARVSFRDKFIGQVAARRQPVYLASLAEHSQGLGEDVERLGLRGALAFPVLMGDAVMAVLEFFSHHPVEADARLTEMFTNVGIQLGHVYRRKRLEREVAMIADQEHLRLGQEMHDGLSQQISAISMLAGTLVGKLGSAGSAHAEQARDLQIAAEQAKRQCRALNKDILPVDVDPEGLMFALRALAVSTEERYGIKCEFQCERPVLVADSFTATHLYRIAREAVHNAVKHARAAHIWIELRADGAEQVVIRDDGIGVAERQPEGEGIKIMRHRASLIGAALSVMRSDAGGTLVSCMLKK